MKRHFEGDEDRPTGSEKHNVGGSPSVKCQGTTDMFSRPRKFPFYRQPKEIGNFSHGLSREHLDSNRSLKYLARRGAAQDVNFDLRNGYKNYICKDDVVKEYLDHLLKWVTHHRDRFTVSQAVSPDFSLYTDFICWRGLLTTLLTTPYENRDGWIISVIRFQDTWYMCAFDTDEKKLEKLNETEKQKEMCYWGYKFEQYMVSDGPSLEPDTSQPVNSNESYCAVIRTRLENNSLVFGGEVDCCKVTSSGSKPYVELKTSRKITAHRQDINFKRFKLIKWWAQSFLIGIKEIICGFRDDDGVVEQLKSFNTLKIPELCKDIRNPWDPAVCFNFLNQFLELVKSTVTENDPRKCYVFSWKPLQDIKYWPSTDADYLFLPEWYIEDMTEPPSQGES